MKTYKARLRSQSPYSQSRGYTAQIPALEKEGKDDYERRTWMNRLHTDKKGMVYIPPMAIKNCLDDTARFMSMQIPGKGKRTYTKHFNSGIMVVDKLELGIHKDEVEGEWLFVPSDGKPGGGSRVWRCFPLIPEWEADAVIHVLDDTITGDVLLRHLQEGGTLRGIGRFRPANRGFYGRFEVTKFDDVSAAAEAAE